MEQLTKEELVFVINVLAEINVQVKNPQSLEIVGKAQQVINKLSKMVDSLGVPEATVDKTDTV